MGAGQRSKPVKLVAVRSQGPEGSQRDCGVLNVLGASIQFLVGPQQDEDDPCILKRTIPPGISVPMHSHDFVEVFFVLSGNFEVIIGDGKKCVG